MTWDNHGVTIDDPEQVVLEADPYRAAVLHLAHLHAGARRGRRARRGARRRAVAGEPRSKVTFELEPLGEMVKLTVVHDGFEPTASCRDGQRRLAARALATSRRCSRPARRCRWPSPRRGQCQHHAPARLERAGRCREVREERRPAQVELLQALQAGELVGQRPQRVRAQIESCAERRARRVPRQPVSALSRRSRTRSSCRPRIDAGSAVRRFLSCAARAAPRDPPSSRAATAGVALDAQLDEGGESAIHSGSAVRAVRRCRGIAAPQRPDTAGQLRTAVLAEVEDLSAPELASSPGTAGRRLWAASSVVRPVSRPT